MRTSRLGVLFVVALVGCVAHTYTVGHYQNVTAYKIGVTYKTVKGIKVDDPKNELYPRIIEKMTDEVEACIAALPAKWTPEQVQAGYCATADVPRSIDREKLTVKVPPGWFTSSCSSEQEFTCDVDPRLCDQKFGTIGQPRDPKCPCACRATIQSGAVLTTPNMKLYKAELARLITGCNTVWFAPLQECVHTPAYPLVDPGL